ncbi:hypothetical protein [Arcanobacterium buesumense]|nr:hypothetical protein [Arcanobacterium buesumense]
MNTEEIRALTEPRLVHENNTGDNTPDDVAEIEEITYDNAN